MTGLLCALTLFGLVYLAAYVEARRRGERPGWRDLLTMPLSDEPDETGENETW